MVDILFLCKSSSFTLVNALKGSIFSIKLKPSHTVLNPDKTLISEMSVRRLWEQSRISSFGRDIRLSSFVIEFLSRISTFSSSSPSSKGIFLNCLLVIKLDLQSIEAKLESFWVSHAFTWSSVDYQDVWNLR
jgi:hypothetical protein